MIYSAIALNDDYEAIALCTIENIPPEDAILEIQRIIQKKKPSFN